MAQLLLYSYNKTKPNQSINGSFQNSITPSYSFISLLSIITKCLRITWWACCMLFLTTYSPVSWTREVLGWHLHSLHCVSPSLSLIQNWQPVLPSWVSQSWIFVLIPTKASSLPPTALSLHSSAIEGGGSPNPLLRNELTFKESTDFSSIFLGMIPLSTCTFLLLLPDGHRHQRNLSESHTDRVQGSPLLPSKPLPLFLINGISTLLNQRIS